MTNTDDFYAKLKEWYAVKPDPSHTEAQLKEDFVLEVDQLIRFYLDAMDESLETINSRVTAFFQHHQHQGIDPKREISKLFEMEVAYEATKWLASDESLRTRLMRIRVAFNTRLKPQETDQLLVEKLAAFQTDFELYAAKANRYGKAWRQHIKTAGLNLIMPDTSVAIKWFELTTAEQLNSHWLAFPVQL
jgi:hypothetical protein